MTRQEIISNIERVISSAEHLRYSYFTAGFGNNKSRSYFEKNGEYLFLSLTMRGRITLAGTM